MRNLCIWKKDVMICRKVGYVMDYKHCTLCPRRCGANRSTGQLGFCRCPDTALVAKTMIHKWEEPALAGSGGSGAIFFGGCTLGCKYCQNAKISGGAVGKPVDSAGLRAMMEDLIARALYEQVTGYAGELGCGFITLNVWCGNDGAMKFYEKAGLTPRNITMEMKLC